MMSARSIFAVACSFLALSLFACAKGSTGGGFGGSGGEGGDDWGGPGPGSSSSSGGGGGSSSSSSSSSSSGSGGSSACDNKGVCSDCADCASTTGSCVGVYNACNANTSCLNLATCIGNCLDGDDVCVDNCASTYSAGIDDLVAYQDCVVCVGCPVDCDAATYMCP
ncbi:hypothetical protein [Polyangium sp. 6x1]|uniref:hypothetical protein n=1 Tax=Polyangium sp. 6x1 TaxID=3042689 RepID=UPI002482F140|nr:hypothetical protein [Polyangium sp. 6x1]MDI1448850.1 hypothetical protein [Polyangium sp. 6x1]